MDATPNGQGYLYPFTPNECRIVSSILSCPWNPAAEAHSQALFAQDICARKNIHKGQKGSQFLCVRILRYRIWQLVSMLPAGLNKACGFLSTRGEFVVEGTAELVRAACLPG